VNPAEKEEVKPPALDGRGSAGAIKPEEEVQVTYDALRRSLASRPDQIQRLEIAQQTWANYLDAHILERYPLYVADPTVYGSVLSTCLAAERASSALVRLRDLRRSTPCEGDYTVGQAEAAAEIADAALNDAYRTVRSVYVQDQTFLAAFKVAQLAWLKFRAAQIEFVQSSSGGLDRACAAKEFEHLVRVRTEEIRRWLNPPEEGEVCRGSFGAP
jgi:uncharacterized protein YecT (DUF1311 family)